MTPREAGRGGFLRNEYAWALKRLRYAIIVVWLGMAIGFGVICFDFPKSTKQDFSAPDGSQAYDAQQQLREYFPGIADTDPYMVYVVTPNATLNYTAGSPAFTFTAAVSAELMALCVTSKAPDCEVVTSTQLQDFPAFASQLKTRGGALVVLTSTLPQNSDASLALGRQIQGVVDKARTATLADAPEMKAGVVGSTLLVRDVANDIDRQLALTTSLVLVVAFVMLGFTVRSLRLLLLPLLSVVVTFLVSFGVMDLVSKSLAVSAVVPGVMLSLCLAMSIDYSLFIIARFKKEALLQGTDDAVAEVIDVVGSSILTSGAAFALACCGLIAFPVSLIRGFGVGCAVTIIVASLVNVTLIPALLMAVPSFFTPTSTPPSSKRCFCYGATADEELPLTRSQADLDTNNASRQESSFQTPRSSDANSPFQRINYLLDWPLNLIFAVAIVALAGVLGWQGSLIDTTAEYADYFDRDSTTAHDWTTLKDVFTPGLLVPYHIVLKASTTGCGNVTANFSNAVARVSAFASATLFLEVANAAIVAIINDTAFEPRVTADQFLPFDLRSVTSEALALLKYAYVDETTIAAAVKFFPLYDPMGPQGQRYYDDLKAQLDDVKTWAELQHCDGFEAYVAGQAPAVLDQMATVYRWIPSVFGITAVSMLIVLTVSFRSPFVALRCLCGVAVTLCITFGLAKLVFQSPGLLKWLTWANLRNDGVGWLAPVNAFVIAASMSIDYHVYFTSIITNIQFRDDPTRVAAKPRESIVIGLCECGGVMTSASGVMATAYLGLLLTNTPLLNVLGFMLVIGVLLDALVVRSVLMPCLMSLLKDWNWWPRLTSQTREPTTSLGETRDTATHQGRSDTRYVQPGDNTVSPRTGEHEPTLYGPALDDFTSAKRFVGSV